MDLCPGCSAFVTCRFPAKNDGNARLLSKAGFLTFTERTSRPVQVGQSDAVKSSAGQWAIFIIPLYYRDHGGFLKLMAG